MIYNYLVISLFSHPPVILPFYYWNLTSLDIIYNIILILSSTEHELDEKYKQPFGMIIHLKITDNDKNKTSNQSFEKVAIYLKNILQGKL